MIYLKPLEEINEEILEKLTDDLEEKFETPCQALPASQVSKEAFEPGRNQYLAPKILASLPQEVSKKGKVLGILNVDLFTPSLNFVFGQATKDYAILSLFRLKSDDQELFYQRVLKEAAHELGHAFGLSHCPNFCLMAFSNSLSEVDQKPEKFCRSCRGKLEWTKRGSG